MTKTLRHVRSTFTSTVRSFPNFGGHEDLYKEVPSTCRWDWDRGRGRDYRGVCVSRSLTLMGFWETRSKSTYSTTRPGSATSPLSVRPFNLRPVKTP